MPKINKRGAMKYGIIIFLVIANILVLTLLLSPTKAIPQDFSINGRLTDSSGASQRGTYNFTFRIYLNDTGNLGTAIYTLANRTITTDSNGVFTARITNLTLNFSDQYYLGIQVVNDAEMTPRINLTSSAYTFRAQNISIEGVEFVRNVNIGNNNFTVNGTTLFVD